MERIKKLVKVVLYISILLLSSMLPVKVMANSGSVRIYYRSNLSPGLTTSIKNLLNGYGYSASVAADPSKATLSAALSGINKIVFVHSHGNANTPVIECSNGNLIPSEVTSSNIQFAYLSTCYSAKVYPSATSFRARMTALGVPMTVGFQDKITAIYNYDRIHFFNNRVFSYMTQNYMLITALSQSQTDTYSTWGTFAGSNFVVFSGGSYHLP